MKRKFLKFLVKVVNPLATTMEKVFNRVVDKVVNSIVNDETDNVKYRMSNCSILDRLTSMELDIRFMLGEGRTTELSASLGDYGLNNSIVSYKELEEARDSIEAKEQLMRVYYNELETLRLEYLTSYNYREAKVKIHGLQDKIEMALLKKDIMSRGY